MTVEQLEAMEVLETLNNDPRFVLDMDYRPGDLQLLNNYTIMHARTEYEKYPDPTRERNLIRLWLTIDRDLGLPASIKGRAADTAHGRVRGSIRVDAGTFDVPAQ